MDYRRKNADQIIDIVRNFRLKPVFKQLRNLELHGGGGMKRLR